MECSYALFWVLAVLVLGIWLRRLSVRTRFAELRLTDLEAEIRRLEQELGHRATEPVREVPETRRDLRAGEDHAAASDSEPEWVVAPTPPEQPEPPAEPKPETERGRDGPAPGEPAAPPPEPRRIEWERWLGVRGAAVLGAAALALAGFLFLKFSIEHGLIPPAVRVTLGVLAGLGAVVGSELLRRRPRRYDATANALAGAGVVLLYGAVWAARALYGLIPGTLAFLLMALVTAACGALSWRYGSMVIATLGLVGGFATPALLAAGEDRPIALFGYLLLLDAGLLVLAVRRGWPVLAAAALALTALYQGFWIVDRMDAERALLGLLILGLFAAVFALAARSALDRAVAGPTRADRRARLAWRLAQAGAVLLPLTFAFRFAGTDLGRHLLPLIGLLLLLSALASWLDRGRPRPVLGLAAAAADLAIVTAWTASARFDLALAWELAAGVIALALVFHLFFELEASRGRGTGGRREWPSLAAAAGFLALLALLCQQLSGPLFWPWLAGVAGLAALLWRQGGRPERWPRRWIAGLGLGVAFGLCFLAQDEIWPVLSCALAAALGVQWLALSARGAAGGPRVRRPDAAAFAMPIVLLVLLVGAAPEPGAAPSSFAAVCLAFGVLAALAATRLGFGLGYAAAVGVTALVHLAWSRGDVDAGAGLAIFSLAAVVFTAWPFAVAGRSLVGGGATGLTADAWTWRGAAMAGPAWFLPLQGLFEARYGDQAAGLLPALLGVLSLAAAFGARRLEPLTNADARGRLAWFAAAALGFAAVAVPLQLEREWITLGWALQGFAVLALWRRLDHPGLKYFGLALLAAATARLVVNPALLGDYPKGGLPVLNWLLYTYLVPAAALIGAAAILNRHEVARQPDWEARLWKGRPAGAVACGVASILVVFAWINLTIFDAFSTGDRLAVSFERLPARDLATSLSWIAYALVLLALGMARSSRGLRWISLGFLVLAIGKVFLYDLGELTDLYRVASLLGLAVSLILVSLAYQRFVFGKRRSGS